MSFEAKALLPSACDADLADGVFDNAVRGRVTLLATPAGYVLTEGLVSAFARLGRSPIWLRLGPEDRDPAAFLLSLVAAARRHHGDAGAATLSLMRRRPGPVFGWAPLFTQLGRDLRPCVVPRGALVLEDVHRALAGGSALSMISGNLLPQLEGVAPCVFVTDSNQPVATLDKCVQRSANELRLTEPTVRRALAKWAPDLSTRARNRVVALVAGRAAILAAVRDLHVTAGPGLGRLIEHAASGEELLARIAGVLLGDVARDSQSALGLATRIEYAHPAMMATITGKRQLPLGPWLQRLEDDWFRVRPCWQQPLRAALGRLSVPARGTLHDSADWLLQAGAYEQAVSLYLDICDLDCAARVIASRASRLMDLGQWETLGTWLARLPEDAFAAYPELNYDRADIAAASGNVTTARRWFDLAAAQYAKRDDAEGSCRSMLAASAAAAEAGDLACAQSRAQAASSLAHSADLSGSQIWAAWQLGRVALAAGDNDAALASFCLAASATAGAGDLTAARSVKAVGGLAIRVRELRQRQESYREAQAALARAEDEALSELRAAVGGPAEGCEEAFGTLGWSRVPAPLRLPTLTRLGEAVPASRARPLSRLRRVLLPRLSRGPSMPAELIDDDERVPGEASGPLRLLPAVEGPAADAAPPAAAGPPDSADARASPNTVPACAQLAIHLLGPLCVAVDGGAVEDWPSARCRSLLGYLVTHRQRFSPRETLMEVFWPESPPDAGRNSLNVAIHGLRRILRTITHLPIVVHEGGAYGINRDLRLWLDVEEFDSHVESGRRLEEQGKLGEATSDYEFAASLYRGDFMADDPYEDWTAFSRERLRLAHLDALSRLSDLYFNVRQYTVCASLCLRIIQQDPCREDAHRRLMRCYSRQGLPHLALMQYRACAQALADQLGVEADPSTAELCQRIRRHERV